VQIYRALLIEYRALLIEYRALLIEYRALFIVSVIPVCPQTPSRVGWWWQLPL